MISSPKAKAIIAAIFSIVLGGLGTAASAVNAGTWNAQTTIALITTLVVSIGATFGVYQQVNTPTA